MSGRRRSLIRLLLLTTTAGFAGCATMDRHVPFVEPEQGGAAASVAEKMSLPVREPLATKVEPPPATQQVAYQQAIASDDDGAIRAAEPFMDDGAAVAVQPMPNAPLPMSLGDFESLAMAHNPTLQQLQATAHKAAGFRTQVGLRANPTVGYQATQLADQGTDQHTVFVSQTIVTGDKLDLNERVLTEAQRAQWMQLEVQRYRVQTDIQVKFYDALAAQRRIELIGEFQSVADTGLELAELRKQALEGSQLDVVQAVVQKNEIDLALQQSRVQYTGAWRELAALTGMSQLADAGLRGELPEQGEQVDWDELTATMTVTSPEFHAAQARVRQARANLARQCVQPIPNVEVQFAAGVDNGTDNGLINLQIGAPLPLFNKNQGNIAAARAEFTRACKEVERIENSIKSRIGAVAREYDSALAAVAKYTSNILPNARQGLELAEVAYKAGETSFVQVLVARRSFFDTNLQFIESQMKLAQTRARIDGFVLTGSLEPVIDQSGDDSLRGLTFSQQ